MYEKQTRQNLLNWHYYTKEFPVWKCKYTLLSCFVHFYRCIKIWLFIKQNLFADANSGFIINFFLMFSKQNPNLFFLIWIQRDFHINHLSYIRHIGELKHENRLFLLKLKLYMISFKNLIKVVCFDVSIFKMKQDSMSNLNHFILLDNTIIPLDKIAIKSYFIVSQWCKNALIYSSWKFKRFGSSK